MRSEKRKQTEQVHTNTINLQLFPSGFGGQTDGKAGKEDDDDDEDDEDEKDDDVDR